MRAISSRRHRNRALLRWAILAFALFASTSDAQMLQSIVNAKAAGGAPPAFTISCAGSASTSSVVACSGTYTGTAPASFSTAVWQAPCSGSVTPPAATFSGGTWGPVNFPTPSSTCTGPLLATTNIPTSNTSGSVVISGGGAGIALVSNTQIISTSNGAANGGTSPSINTTGATLLVVAVSQYKGATLTAPTDAVTGCPSPCNTWIPLTAQQGFTESYIRFFYAANPTVGTNHTVSVTNTAIAATTQVASFSGVALTSPLDVQNGNGCLGGCSNISTGVTPTHPNSLVLTAVSYDAAFALTAPSGFTMLNAGPFLGSQYEGGGLAYVIQTTATPVTALWVISGDAAATIAAFHP